MKVKEFINDIGCFDILGQQVHLFCSGCNEQKSCKGFNEYGLPTRWFKCECGKETELPSKQLSTEWWEGFWMQLMNKLNKLDPSIHQKLPTYIIQCQKNILNNPLSFKKYQN